MRHPIPRKPHALADPTVQRFETELELSLHGHGRGDAGHGRG